MKLHGSFYSCPKYNGRVRPDMHFFCISDLFLPGLEGIGMVWEAYLAKYP